MDTTTRSTSPSPTRDLRALAEIQEELLRTQVQVIEEMLSQLEVVSMQTLAEQIAWSREQVILELREAVHRLVPRLQRMATQCQVELGNRKPDNCWRTRV